MSRFICGALLLVMVSGALGGCQGAKPPVAAPKFKTEAQKNYYEVWKAIRDSDLGELKRLVKAKPGLAKVSGNSGTPLHWAAENDANPALCEFLLQAGADPNVFDPKGQTPLLLAVRGRTRAGKTRVVKMLLAKGAKPDVRNQKNGATPLYSAAVVGDLPVVKLLLGSGANPNIATQKGDTPLKHVLKAQHDLDINAPYARALAKWTNEENFPAIIQLLRQAGGK